MRDFKDNLSDRLKTAAEAKKAMLSKAARPSPDDPAEIERRAQRQAIVEAREARAIEKAQTAKELAEQQALDIAARAEQKKRDEREMADLEVARAAEQKAIRDAKYAARKKRKA
ncbi:DUF6481 family protein [Hyphomicrobium sp.]|uniref:DUF6481 family protein n=1 Tax=Hyphomicrobium sp. TaxID=82 RepID=UPI003F7309F8